MDFGKEYSRGVLHGTSDAGRIDAAWQEKTLANPSMFNGLKFRLAGVDDGCLRLGITDYRTFQVRD